LRITQIPNVSEMDPLPPKMDFCYLSEQGQRYLKKHAKLNEHNQTFELLYAI